MKKRLKTIFSVALAVLMVMALAGCGSSSDSSTSGASNSNTSGSVSSSESESSAASASGGGNVLVVYYSATGNTASVAKTIADTLDADIFEITPTDPYTDDDLNWSDDSSRVSKEHEDESLQDQVELTTTQVENWDSYDTVFFGYPIWWGDAAWPVNQFVQNNDFSGKTVIPFCTSASSGIGQSGANLAEMAGTGDWQEGQRFSSSPDSDDVASWAQSVVS